MMRTEANPLERTVEERVEDLAELTGGDLWNARPELRTIRDSARASVTAPYAVLGCVLASVAEAVPPSVVLPPIGNGKMAVATLNVFFALVAPSGGSKGTSTRTARGVLGQRDPRRKVEPAPIGSGEGIAASYIKSDAGADDEPEDTVREVSIRFDIPEVDMLTALSSRQGTTVTEQLRQLWSGEVLGNANSPKTRRIIPEHMARGTVVMGVQPLRAGPLLQTGDGGTLQRFVFLPAMDPGAANDTPPLPPSLGWKSPFAPVRSSDFHVMDVSPEIREEIRLEAIARLRGQVEDENGHRTLSRLKIAALLGILAERRDVNLEDWYLSGLVMAESDRTLDYIRAVRRREQLRETAARGASDARRTDAAEEAAVDIAAKAVEKLLSNGEVWTTGALYRKLTVSKRPNLDSALDRLAASDKAVVWQDGIEGKEKTMVRHIDFS
jgi:hypothetical protein